MITLDMNGTIITPYALDWAKRMAGGQSVELINVWANGIKGLRVIIPVGIR